MRTADPDARTNGDEPRRRAPLDVWPLPKEAAVPEADEPLDRSEEGEDEPITEKVPVSPSREPPRSKR